jgi:hypothetical protein
MWTIEKASRRNEMFALIEQKQRNQTNKGFCEQRGIAQSCFYYWLKKYRQEQTRFSGFVPMLVKPSTSNIIQQIEINYPSGITVRVPAGSSVTLLKTLIDIISRCG